MNKIGFIGMGNMGQAMLKGILSLYSIDIISFVDKSEDIINKTKLEFGVKYFENSKLIVENSKYVLLTVKPQIYESVLNEIKDYITPNHVIITVAPGFSIEKVKNIVGENIKVMRSMPNTPALVGEAISAISFSKDNFSNNEIIEINKIFSSFGEVETIEENLMNAIVPISGSSPAYVYMFIEALADGGVSMGLPRNLAYKLAAQTVLGSGKMVLETKLHPGILKDNVCSPGGTTIEGVASLEKSGFRSSVIEAMKKVYEKSLYL